MQADDETEGDQTEIVSVLTTNCGCVNMEKLEKHVAADTNDCVPKYLSQDTPEKIDCVPYSVVVEPEIYPLVFESDSTGAPGLCEPGVHACHVMMRV